jgi:hypothetical protein
MMPLFGNKARLFAPPYCFSIAQAPWHYIILHSINQMMIIELFLWWRSLNIYAALLSIFSVWLLV